MKGTDEISKGWVIPYLKQYKWSFLLAGLLGTLAVLCAGALLFTSGYLISRSALRPENVLMVYVPIVLVRTFGFSKAILQYVDRLIGHNAVLRVLSSMRVRLYRLLEPQAIRLRSRFQTGDLLHLLAEDIEQLQHVYLRIVLPAVTAVLIYGAGIAALGRMDGMFALGMGLYCGFWLLIAPVIALWKSMPGRRRFKEEKSEAYRELTDALFGMSDWVLSGRSRQLLSSFQKRQTRMSKLENKLRRSEWFTQWLTRLAIGGAVLLMVVWAGQMAAAQQIEPSWIAALGLVAFPLMEALVRVMDALLRAPEYQDSLQRLLQIEAEGVEDKTRGDSSVKPQVLSNPGSIDLHLERLIFCYPNEQQPSVQEISLHLPQGYKMAILGRSGSGKSTLLNLIQGELRPDQGQVLANGVHVHDLSLRPFSVLNQKPYLFDTTIMNNVRLGRGDASDAEVREAIKQVGLEPLIESLPDGYDTRMEEAGSRFSGGERQRIALARILLQNYPIVLLDEPMVGLDPVTEMQLIETMLQVLEGKTLIWVTHHLVGVERMDEIVFMNQGQIKLRGTHELLYREEARYRQLYELDHI